MNAAVYFILFLELLFALMLLKLSGCLKKPTHWVFSVLLLLLAFAARAYVFDYETLDYKNFLSKWIDYFRVNGGFRALKNSVGNYNIPYLYFLALFSMSDIGDLYLIKLLSTFFDVLLAWSAMMILSEYRESVPARLGCFFTVLFLPTVFLNSAVWGQCDSTYTAMLLLGIWLALDDRPWLSMICAAVGFGFKLQAVFVLPVFAVLWMRGKFRWYHFAAFPAAYVVLVLPAVLIGRPFIDTLKLYSSQASSIYYPDILNYNSSSVFAIIGKACDPKIASTLGITAAFTLMSTVLVLCLVVCINCRYGTPKGCTPRSLSDRTVLASALLFAVGIPFLLPYMHDRYFYCADIITVAAAFAVPKLAAAASLTQFASLLGYYAYLRLRFLMPMKYGSFALIAVLILAGVFFGRSLHEDCRIVPQGGVVDGKNST